MRALDVACNDGNDGAAVAGEVGQVGAHRQEHGQEVAVQDATHLGQGRTPGGRGAAAARADQQGVEPAQRLGQLAGGADDVGLVRGIAA